MILIRFPSRQALDDCFGSEEYRQIMKKRMDSVDARAVVVEGTENPAKDKSVHDIPGSENR